jgi:hypothetical protein
LTTKSYRKQCELKNAGGKITITVRETDADAEPIDFNFFVIDPEVNRGLYLQYRNSCGVATFEKFLHSHYVSKSKEQLENEILAKQLKPGGKEAKKLRKQYSRPRLSIPLIVRDENLKQQLLNRLSAIKKMSFDYNVLSSHGGVFSPLAGAVKGERHTLSFDPKVTKRSLVNAILDFVGKANLVSGRVHGPSTNDATLEDAVDLVYNPDVFASLQYDDIADEQAFTLSNVHQSAIAKELQKVIAAHPVLFPAKT